MSQRPVWYIWLVNAEAALCRFKGDAFHMDNDGLTTCEYPICIQEQLVKAPDGDKHNIAYHVRPISALVNIAEVRFILAGYTRCDNEALIKLWEGLQHDLQANAEAKSSSTEG